MYTRVQGTRPIAQTKSEQIITIPNEQILTNPVMNYSRMGDLYSDDVTISITRQSNWRKATEIMEIATSNAIKKFIKTNTPATFAEKRSWQEAIALLQQASNRLRRGFVKESVQEKIEMLKTAETTSQIEPPKPRILTTIGQYSIDLNVLYQTDLYSVRNTKNEVVRSILEAIEKRDDIELAYAQTQFTYEEKPKKFTKQEKLFKNPKSPPQ